MHEMTFSFNISTVAHMDHTLVHKASRIIPQISLPRNRIAGFSSPFLLPSEDLYLLPPAEAAVSLAYSGCKNSFRLS
jgi:hypothetical protein